jgi:copper chaperone NosL
MQHPLARFYELLDRPLHGAGRLLLALAVIPLVLSFSHPLWRIHLTAPQYPGGLTMEIYAHKLDGGNRGQHIQEINTLNHYIGMHKIDRAELSDLDWLPFAFGILALLALRCAAIGNVRALVDLAVVTTYVSGFAMARFVHKLYVFGHDLDPTAPVKVAPFTPAILGTKQIANFTTESLPRAGSLLVGLFATVVIGVTVWHLVAGRRAAARAERLTAARRSRSSC